jgi:hypothetical protein
VGTLLLVDPLWVLVGGLLVVAALVRREMAVIRTRARAIGRSREDWDATLEELTRLRSRGR